MRTFRGGLLIGLVVAVAVGYLVRVQSLKYPKGR